MNHPEKGKIKFGTSILFALMALMAVSVCEARTKVVDSWRNEEAPKSKPDKIAVIAVLPDTLTREAFEIDVVKKLKKRGRNIIASSKLRGMAGGIRGQINTEAALKALRANSVDGIIVMFYSGGGVSGTYARSDYWLRYEGSGVGYNWGRPYFTSVYSVQQGPGFTDFRTSALVESSYYDLETEQPVWRIVTETNDTEHSDAAVEIGRRINTQMRRSKH